MTKWLSHRILHPENHCHIFQLVSLILSLSPRATEQLKEGALLESSWNSVLPVWELCTGVIEDIERIIGTVYIWALPWERPADNDSSIFLRSLIEIIKQMGSAFAFTGSGEQFLIGLRTYLLQTMGLVICLFSENQWYILSNLFLAELKALGETGCLPTQSLPECFLFVFESQPPLENI